MMLRRFPRHQMVEGRLDANREPTAPEVLAAMDRADFFLHGSVSATFGHESMERLLEARHRTASIRNECSPRRINPPRRMSPSPIAH